jgi:hypothetical protein
VRLNIKVVLMLKLWIVAPRVEEPSGICYLPRRRDDFPANARGIVYECGITRLDVVLSTGCTPIPGPVVREQD